MSTWHRGVVAAVAAAVLVAAAACTGGPGGAGGRSGAGSAGAGPAPLLVTTTSGRLHGLATGTTRQFLGVRYALPPTGSRRWTDPVAAAKAPGAVPATKPGASCAQVASAPGATASTSEDCLFLNVTTPKDLRRGEKLPVMVWWHGGGYTSGSGSAYDAQRLATRGRVMVVTVNYRLGVFGYLSLPGLTGSGDFGLADQILATRWAKRNAAAFGGDPGNVTVFGESAGAMSACALLTSPAARGLVDKVAMSSGGTCRLAWPQDGLLPSVPRSTPYLPLAGAEALGVSQARTLGCTGSGIAQCLRGRTTAQLLKIFPLFSNALAYGTPLLPADPARAVTRGPVSTVPTLSGNNRDEQRAFVGGVQKAMPTYTAAAYPGLLRRAFGADAARVAAEYPLGSYASAADAWADLITGASWACPTLAGNAALARRGAVVFGYEFDDPGAPDVNGVTSSTFAPRAAHATDVPYLFDLGGRSLLRTSAQKQLADQMIDYWTSFARDGRPSSNGAASWPRLTGADGPTLQLRPGRSETVDLAAEHRCDFWRTVSY